ncbi:MAG: methyltransferase domain-containing protein [Pseudomonadota bacterium]
MTDTPSLTDRPALLKHRARVSSPDDLFLHAQAADELHERLQEVNRTFTNIAVVTGFPQFWEDRFPGARIVPDTDTLDLEVGVFDLVVHAMALHWANDPVGQLVQCRRALKRDGLFLGVCLGGQTLSELRSVLAQAETALRGGLSPRVAPMGEVRDLGGLLQRAGLALPVADTAPLQVSYQSALHLMHDLRRMGETNALSLRDRAPLRRDVLLEAKRLYQDHFAAEGDRITATFELIFLSGWAPDESQQKPLRPGSAKHRLADALGTVEIPADDPPDSSK